MVHQSRQPLVALVLLLGVAWATASPAPERAAAPAGAVARPRPTSGADAPAPGRSSPTPEPTRVTYGIAAPSFSFMPIRVAERRGFYRQQGLAVETEVMTPVTIAAGQLSGAVDYGSGYIQAVRAGRGQFRLVSSQVTGPIFVLMARPGIGSVADLRGQTIGTGSRGAAVERETTKIVEHFGLVPDRDVTLLPFPEMRILLQGLLQGQIDAAALSPPWHTRGREQGMIRLLSAAEIDPEPQNGLVVTSARLQADRDQVRRVVMAEIEALRFIRAQRAETESVMREWLGLSADEAREGYDAALPVMSPDGQLDRAGIAHLIESEQAAGTVPADLTVDAVIEPTLAAEALRALDAAPPH